jgi:uncharacterized spore protein YtfJ
VDPQQMLTGVQEALSARRTFGDPITADGVTVIPVSVVTGGGGGGGSRADQGGGGGFRVTARPAGLFAIHNGSVSWHPALDLNRVIFGGQVVAVVAILTMRPLIQRWFESRNSSGLTHH